MIVPYSQLLRQTPQEPGLTHDYEDNRSTVRLWCNERNRERFAPTILPDVRINGCRLLHPPPTRPPEKQATERQYKHPSTKKIDTDKNEHNTRRCSKKRKTEDLPHLDSESLWLFASPPKIQQCPVVHITRGGGGSRNNNHDIGQNGWLFGWLRDPLIFLLIGCLI